MTLSMADLPTNPPNESGARNGTGSGPRSGQPVRRIFTDTYKLAILNEYELATERGARAALLRREGLYESTVRKWAKARDRGTLSTTPTAPGRVSSGDAAELRRLRRENARLTTELQRTQAVLEVVGKVHDLLEVISERPDQQ